MKKQIKMILMLVGAFIVLNLSCRKNDHPGFPCDQSATGENDADFQNAQVMKSGANVPAQWYALAIKLGRTTPGQNIGPINARAFGYIGLALYESVVPGLARYQSIEHQLNGLPTLPKTNCGDFYFYPASANAALANMVHHMFGNTSASQNFTIDSLENSFNMLFGSIIPKNDLDRSSAFGRDISNAIYSWSVTDGADQGYLTPYPTTYIPPTGVGLWVPLTGQLAQVPYWGNTRPFIKNNTASTQPAPPPAYSTDPSSQLYKEEMEVYNESINQDPEHVIIAKYWAALPGPSASISVLSAVLANKNAPLSVTAEAYCKVGIAISDALVSCYKTKYVYNQLRPQAYIQANFNATWKPLLATPPFPDYTSAHSVQTGAAARVFEDMFGDNTTFTDDRINSLGFAPRTFTKFSDYANEVGLSRI
ncbi:MAG TPA: vanadium-dependent haloperoxidase [Ginsengibacter sp.]